MSETGIIKRVWSEDVRRQAYDLWAGPAQQNVSEAARQLSEIVGETVGQTTVHSWSVTDRWKDRQAVEQLAAVPVLMDQYVARLWVAVPNAIYTISAIASGELSAASNAQHVDLDRRLRAATFIVDKAQALLLKQADRTQRTGGRRQAAVAVDLKSMTQEQLRTYEAELNRDR
jgi:hypothetical protein